MKKFLLTISFSFIFALSFAAPTFAADITVSTQKQQVDKGEQFEVTFSLNNSGQSINALEGTLNFDESAMELTEVRTGNSIVNFWLEKPMVGSSTVSFSGITPGGYSGQGGIIFSAIFQATKTGTASIGMSGLQAFVNDGKGTAIPITSKALIMIISTTSVETQAYSAPVDTDPPEVFTPQIGSDPNLFDGKYFVAFAANDKGSGIASYQVCEGSENNCVTATSPYMLADQSLHQKIFVKAFDVSGNVRTVTVPPEHPLPWWEDYKVLGILILVIVAFLLFKIL